MKKSNRIIAVSVLLIVLVLAIVPSLLKKKVTTLMVEEVEASTDLQVKYESIGVSFFRNFPRIKVDVKAFQLESPTETVLHVERFKGELSLNKILKNELELTKAELTHPRYNFIIKDELDSSDEQVTSVSASQESQESTQQSLFAYNVKSFTIIDGEILYQGKDSLQVQLQGIDMLLSGHLDKDELMMKAQLTVASVDYKTLGFTMKSIPLNFDAQMKYILASEILLLEDNTLGVGGFTTSLLGQVTAGDSPDFDINFEAPKTDIKSVLELLPSTLVADVDMLEANGDVSLNGFVKGKYEGIERLPAFGVDFTVADAWFKYKELPTKVDNINISAKVSHPAGTNADSTLIAVEKWGMTSGKNSITAKLNITKPATDVTVKGNVKSSLDFATLKNAIPMNASDIVGQVNANISFDGRLTDIEQENYQDFDASGQLTLKQYYIKNRTMPQGLSVSNATMQFTPSRINISSFNGKLGSSDLRLNGYLSNYFAYLFDDKTLNGSLKLSSKSLNINEFVQREESTSTASPSSSLASKEKGALIVPRDLNLVFNSSITKVKVDNLDLNNFKGKISIKDSKILLDNLTFATLDGQVTANGEYNSQNAKAVYSDMDLKLTNIEVAKATKSISVLRKMLPISQTTQGKISSEMHYFAQLDAKGDVDMKSIKSKGYVKSPGLRIANNRSLDDLAKQLKDPRYKDITTSAVRIDYTMDKGTITLAPFDVKMVDKNINAGGWYSIDNTISFRIKTTVKAKEIGGDVSKYIGMVSDVNKPLPVTVILTGDAQNPNIKYDTREAIKVLRNDVTKNLNKDAVNSILKGFF